MGPRTGSLQGYYWRCRRRRTLVIGCGMAAGDARGGLRDRRAHVDCHRIRTRISDAAGHAA